MSLKMYAYTSSTNEIEVHVSFAEQVWWMATNRMATNGGASGTR